MVKNAADGAESPGFDSCLVKSDTVSMSKNRGLLALGLCSCRVEMGPTAHYTFGVIRL